MLKFEFDTFALEIVQEHTYSFNSTDNIFQYTKNFFPTTNEYRHDNAIGIKCIVGDDIIDSAIVAGFGGASLHEENVIVEKDRIVASCNNFIACFSIPEITMVWATETDLATCFEIYKIDSGYIVRGEMAISKLDFAGNIQWQFTGPDIFVSLTGQDELVLKEDYIQIKDFNDDEFHIDYNGKVIFDTISNKKKKEGLFYPLKRAILNAFGKQVKSKR